MLFVVKPCYGQIDRSSRMDSVLSEALSGVKVKYLLSAEALGANDLRGKRILFAVCLSEAGTNFEYYRMLEYFRENPRCLAGAVGGIVVDGGSELFTKSLARRLAFSANQAGCAFPGKPLVEATGSLQNFEVLSGIHGLSREETYRRQVGALVERIIAFSPEGLCGKKILAVHASSRKTSNSLLLWRKIRQYLPGDKKVTEISLRNGQLLDCRGCKYEDCLHFGENGECFYGGVMVEKVYPAIIDCDTLVMICPNYNDAVSANITAFINRLTAVFRTNDFSCKRVFALVVSGYSGGDIVTEQIIGAMNFNKSFVLPGNFAMVETANVPESILHVENLEEKVRKFAEQISGDSAKGVGTEL